eukprot:g36908.t1
MDWMCAKSWEKYIAKVKQKLGFWEHCSLSIADKNLVIRCLASLLRNSRSSLTIPYHLFLVEKFAKKTTVDHSPPGSGQHVSVLEIMWEKDKVDPDALFPEQTVKVIWQNTLSLELFSKHQDIAWLV